ncbi:hypothetical protein LLG95_05215 [bacterium]|nr:hypothetical protein [bacterium]
MLDQTVPTAAARPIPPLARAERSGAIDVLLVIVAIAQYYALKQFHLAGSLRIPAWLFGFVAVTWLLLIAGALGSLMRNSPARTGELPRGAGPLLVTWAVMFAVWTLIVFNNWDEVIWGFWHLARFDRDSYAQLSSFMPLAFAPGWRRLYRSLKLAWHARRRAAGRHGLVRFPGWPAFAIAAGIVSALVLRDRAIMSDGWGIMGFARRFGIIEPESYREPLFMMMFREEFRVLHHLGLNIGNVVGWTSTVAMTILAFMFHKRMRHWHYTPRQMISAWLLMLSTLGLTQMFLGHIELYPLLIFGLGATFHTGIDAAERRCSPAWPAIFCAFTLAGHLSAIFVLPGVLMIYWMRATPPGRAFTPVSWPVLLHGMGHLLGWGVLIHGCMWLGLMVRLELPTPAGLVGAVTGSLNTGAERLTFIGSNMPTFWLQAREILAPGNLFKMVQAFFYLTGGPLLACLIAIVCRMMGWKPAPAASRPDPKSAAILWVAFLGYAFYALTWNNDWTWTEDWDLFSGLAPLGFLLALRLLMPLPGVTRLPHALLALACYFVFVLNATQHVYNHTHATYLTVINKFDSSREFGKYIQDMQLEMEFPRYTLFEYKDGRVVVTYPPGYKKP